MVQKKKKKRLHDRGITALPVNDDALQAFREEAQKGLTYLIEFMGDHEKDDELFRYAVKTNFIEHGKSEHMWVQVNEFKDGQFLGRLANEPASMKLIKYGEPVKVFGDDVEDWILEDFLTNTKVGHFSGNYLRNANKK